MTPRAAARAAAHSATTAATIRRAALALLLAAIILAGGTLGGPRTTSADSSLTVSSIAVTSNAGSDDEYHAGEDIVIRVTFSQNIESYTSAALTITLDSGAVTANPPDLTSGGTVATVDYTYTVTDADNDADGIAVATASGTLTGTYVHAGHSTTPTHTSFTLPTMTYGSSLTQSNHKVNVNVTNYDSDGDGLIEIENLNQLNAIRYDLNGSGSVSAANAVAYATAFPGRSQSHGCPDTADADTDPGPCIGYELMADLNFDTNGSGTVDASDDYPNWTPVGTNTSQYTTTFNGNGHTIANLTINATNVTPVGLFGAINNEATIHNLGLVDLSITANRTAGGGFFSVGGFVGYSRGSVRTSYATGTISGTVGAINSPAAFGGLVGFMGFSPNNANNRIDASWAAVNVAVTSSATSSGAANVDSTGGLVGRMVIGSTGTNQGGPATVATSWARGTVSSSRSGSNIGGLIGRMVGTGATATASHWDTTTSSLSAGVGNTANPGVVGKTTTELKSPTDYGASAGDTFFGWNIDVDSDATTGDDTGRDDPWDFGTDSQYPALKYGGHNLVAQGRGIDYDVDDDGLIDITTLAQLNAIRHDLDGNGDPANMAYNSAFPLRDPSVAGRMGCQLTDHDSMPATADRATCTGYELMADLDFDTDGNGSVGAGDDYPNWVPIGTNTAPYTTTFNGNGHTIANLTISSSSTPLGLFGAASSGTPVLENVGLTDVNITGQGSGSGFYSVGGLVGYLRGTVRNSYSTGTISASTSGTHTTNVGGIAGWIGHTGGGSGPRTQLDANWSSVNITVTSTSSSGASDAAGGLVGRMLGTSSTPSQLTTSYAWGAVSSTRAGSNVGGLIGRVVGTSTVTASHWDTTTSSLSAGVGNTANPGVVGRTTTQLKMPTDYGASAGDTFFGWNIDVDGDSNNDDPWDFGTDSQYPILQFARDAVGIALQRGVTITRVDYDTDNDNLIDITTLGQLNGIRYDLDGNGRTTGADSVGYLAAFPGVSRDMGCPAACIGYELMDDLDFDYDNDGSTHTSGTIDPGDAVAATAAYFDSATGWTPIGGHTSSAAPYTAIFEGNGNTIDNLYINLSTSAATDSRRVGLFAEIGKAATTSPAAPAVPGVVRNVGLVDPYVANTRTAASGMTYVYTGALAGRNAAGTVSGSYVSGGSVTATQNTSTTFASNNAGCLLGYNLGAVSDSYASCAASATGNATGTARDYAGGLAGQSEGPVQRSYATGTAMGDDYAGGLFGAVAGGGTVTASYATGAATAGADGGRAGGLVGEASNANTTVTACFATGAATANGGNAVAGGLLGRAISGSTVRASYATGAVVASGSGSNHAGGLVGQLDAAATNVNASYAIGAVDASGGSTNNEGGLVGNITNSATVTNSHWNITVNMFTAESNVSKTTTQLRTPTDYGAAAANAFYGWNIDLDGDSSADDPWDFGTSSDYPVISYGGISLRAQGRTPVDYDADNDGFIDIDSLAKLNAVRHDLDGNGQHDGGTGDTAYNAVFANRDRSAAGLMGCPLADHDDDADTPNQAHCHRLRTDRRPDL